MKKSYTNALEWIKANEDILSISALEQRLRVPGQSLKRFLHDGYFPKIHMEKLAGLRSITRPADTNTDALRVYIDLTMDQYDLRIKELQTVGTAKNYTKHKVLVDIAEARQLEIWDCMVTLYNTLAKDDPGTAAYLHKAMYKRKPVAAEQMKYLQGVELVAVSG